MKKDISKLLDQIIETGKKKGLDQKALAKKAQINVSSISRAKKSNDIKFSTLQSLAQCVGLTLSLVPDSSIAEEVLKGSLFDD
ncbi:MAG: helix-turn-helix domain-containing protein [Gammaproteobacteria bacterium]|nr:helix-turn-helix domain-containing protein [Gammaproteobacteria bacterium]